MKQTEHYVHPAGLAAATTAGIIYVICAFLVSLWPAQTVAIFGSWLHGIDIAKISTLKPLAFGSFLVGLVSVMVVFYTAGALYAFLYNKCVAHCKRKQWI